ncbi:hypothetical protein [Catenuloplanes indicus]|uniref:Uncharacterized protein n=1 Tax=Catenuloplanes indicus TaxID=137267 RepID=A0AAE4AZP9_9ACTN|nr:hypothetical protein [Catenuloplanes indicus]MDQ0366168.1 hypothetical protein [Catenuloplanes indicus]
MARFAPVPVPRCHDDREPGRIAADVAAWVSSAPMRALVAAFGGRLPDAGAGDLLDWLDDFSAVHWDFRRGRAERYEVPPPAFDDATAGLVMDAATALRLVTPVPPLLPAYDHVLVPGGLGRACLQRTHYAAFLLGDRDTGVTAPEVTALGSFRPLTAAERALPGLAGAHDEMDAMHAGIRRAFGVTACVPEEVPDGAVHHYTGAGRGVHVLAAPSSEPELRRANTADTYRFWAERVRLRPDDRVLIVTSPIYVPFQHCEAIRMLGCRIDTVGFDVTRSTALPPVGPTAPDRYLQEIRSTVRSMRALLAAQKSRYTHGSAGGNSVASASRAASGTVPSPRASISSGPSTP